MQHGLSGLPSLPTCTNYDEQTVMQPNSVKWTREKYRAVQSPQPNMMVSMWLVCSQRLRPHGQQGPILCTPQKKNTQTKQKGKRRLTDSWSGASYCSSCRARMCSIRKRMAFATFTSSFALVSIQPTNLPLCVPVRAGSRHHEAVSVRCSVQASAGTV